MAIRQGSAPPAVEVPAHPRQLVKPALDKYTLRLLTEQPQQPELLADVRKAGAPATPVDLGFVPNGFVGGT
ncbi:hypothetical protein [Streptomyces sp. NPDC056682]|uniref:hypothetical protein n=1 Tax=Streptomyces sp. NPDC056682 TaxID=3345909 RepID=UPI0036AC777F